MKFLKVVPSLNRNRGKVERRQTKKPRAVPWAMRLLLFSRGKYSGLKKTEWLHALAIALLGDVVE